MINISPSSIPLLAPIPGQKCSCPANFAEQRLPLDESSWAGVGTKAVDVSSFSRSKVHSKGIRDGRRCLRTLAEAVTRDPRYNPEATPLQMPCSSSFRDNPSSLLLQISMSATRYLMWT